MGAGAGDRRRPSTTTTNLPSHAAIPSWRRRWVVATLLTAIAGTAGAQQTAAPFELHGSLNAAYGRSFELPVYGIPTTGTSDYRVVTLQGRYALGEKDHFVAQVFNRRIGTSPLASSIPDVTMQWAFFQHREGDWTFKAGRNPLPRGLYNEVRYIGTVQPFFRPAMELQQDAFDAIDGAVVSYRHEIGRGIEIEQHAFGGGSENRAIATTSTGMQVRVARTENMFGSQTYLTAPVAGLRLGWYMARYNFVQSSGAGYRTQVLWSAEATPIERVTLSTEHMRLTGYGPSNDNRSGFVQGSVRATSRVRFAGQYAYTTRMLFFTNGAMNDLIPEVRTKGASTTISLTPSTVLKFEHHWRRGWSFDTATPPVASQTANSFTLSPKRDARYFLVSVASSF